MRGMDHECAALTNAYFLAQQERDLATLGQIFSEDFILIEPLTGWIITRKTLLQDVNAGLIEATSHIGMRVHDYGNTVIIRGRVDKKGAGLFLSLRCRLSIHTRIYSGQ